jgi:hypothetical protein
VGEGNMEKWLVPIVAKWTSNFTPRLMDKNGDMYGIEETE